MDIDKMVNHKIAKLSGIIKRQIYQIISEEGLNITVGYLSLFMGKRWSDHW